MTVVGWLFLGLVAVVLAVMAAAALLSQIEFRP